MHSTAQTGIEVVKMNRVRDPSIIFVSIVYSLFGCMIVGDNQMIRFMSYMSIVIITSYRT